MDKVIIIKNEKNIGYAKACNQGIQKAMGKYILLLNPDAQFVNNALNIFYYFMEKEKNSGIWCVGGQLYDENEIPLKSARKYPSLLTILIEQSGVKTFVKLLTNKMKIDIDYSNKNEKRNYFVLGCDMFIRKRVLQEIGLFNESFFLNYEEAELSWRANQKGYKSLILPEAKILHYSGKSFKDLKTYLSYLWIGQLLFFKLTRNQLMFFLAKIFHIIGTILRFLVKTDRFYLQHLKKIQSV